MSTPSNTRPTRRRTISGAGRAVCVWAPIRRRGFSMIELVIVLMIMSLLAGVGIVRFAGAINRSRADAAAARLVADLQLAQSRARSTSRPREVSFPASTNTYVLQDEPTQSSSGAVYRVDLGAEPYQAKVSRVVPGAISGLATGAPSTIRRSALFDGFGTPVWGLNIEITVGTQKRLISVDPTSGKATYASLQ